MSGEAMVLRSDDWYVLEVLDEPGYAFGSAVNTRHYQREELLGDGQHRASRHGVTCVADGRELASVIFGAAGGASGVHERSLARLRDLAFLAVGPFIVCLQLPALSLEWAREVDQATCFGIHIDPEQRGLVCHGELEVSRLTLSGEIVWQASGRDIFTGELSVDSALVRAEDFNGDTYVFDLGTGKQIAWHGLNAEPAFELLAAMVIEPSRQREDHRGAN
jgi:hypothetical protein